MIEADADIVADTDIPMTVQELAELLHRIGKPTTEQDVELSVDPDDYPLF